MMRTITSAMVCAFLLVPVPSEAASDPLDRYFVTRAQLRAAGCDLGGAQGREQAVSNAIIDLRVFALDTRALPVPCKLLIRASFTAYSGDEPDLGYVAGCRAALSGLERREGLARRELEPEYAMGEYTELYELVDRSSGQPRGFSVIAFADGRLYHLIVLSNTLRYRPALLRETDRNVFGAR